MRPVRRKPGQLVPLETAICVCAANLRLSGTIEFHGYQIAKRLGDESNRRLLTAYGTLYRALGRLEAMGLLQSQWGPVFRRENRPGRRLPPHRCRRVAAGGVELQRKKRRSGRAALPQHDIVFCPRSARAQWAWLYTWRMEPGLRSTIEIESDLWASARSNGSFSYRSAAHLLIRLLSGIPDDLCWRIEHDDLQDRLLRRSLTVGAAAAAIVLATTLWVFNAMATAKLPQPPAAMVFVITPPRVPPPPPPPPPPPGRDARRRLK